MADRLVYGWRHDRLLHISQVPKGLAGNCVCPHCRQPLVAKKGERYVHHFSHYRREACRGGLETVLHLLAKDILRKSSIAVLPALYFPGEERPLQMARRTMLGEIRLEKRGTGYVPDLLAKSATEGWIAIEIRVTHPCGREKIRKYQLQGMPVLEIDLSSWKDQPIDLGALRQELVGGTKRKRWLYHPRIAHLTKRIREKARERKVRHYRKGDRHYLRVFNCPLRKRSWENPWGTRNFFAYYSSDCLFCSRCLEVRYGENWVGDRWSFRFPETVLCWGHLPDLPE